MAKLTTMCVCLERDLTDRIRERCKLDGLSISAYIRMLVLRDMRAEETAEGGAEDAPEA